MPIEGPSLRPTLIRSRLRLLDDLARLSVRQRGGIDGDLHHEMDELLMELRLLRQRGTATGNIDRLSATALHEHELATAARLMCLGHEVEFRKPRPGDTADCLIDGLTWDLKAPRGRPARLSEALRHAQRQGGRAVLDLTENPLSMREAQGVIESALARYDLLHVMLVDGNRQQLWSGHRGWFT